MIRSVFNSEASRPQGGACGAHAGQNATAGPEMVLPFFSHFCQKSLTVRDCRNSAAETLLDTLSSYYYTKGQNCGFL